MGIIHIYTVSKVICLKKNVSAKQGIHTFLLIIKNKYGCQIHSMYAYYCWAQNCLAYLFPFTFLFQQCINIGDCLSFCRVWFLHDFLFLMWLLLGMLCLVIGSFIFLEFWVTIILFAEPGHILPNVHRLTGTSGGCANAL